MFALLDGASIVNQLIAIMGALAPFTLFVNKIIKGMREDKKEMINYLNENNRVTALDAETRATQNVFLSDLRDTQKELKDYLVLQNGKRYNKKRGGKKKCLKKTGS